MVEKILFTVYLVFVGANGGLQAKTYDLVSLEYPPLVMSQKDGRPSGAAVEIVTSVFEKMGHSFKLEVKPWRYIYELAKLGHADGIFTIFKIPEREGKFYFSKEVIISQPVGLYSMLPTKGNRWNELVRGKRVGVVSTYSYGKKFDTQREKRSFKVVRSESLEGSFNNLKDGKVNFVVSNELSARHFLKDKDALSAVRRVQTIERVPSYIAFSISRGLLGVRDEFDKNLKVFKKTQKYKEILKRYRLN